MTRKKKDHSESFKYIKSEERKMDFVRGVIQLINKFKTTLNIWESAGRDNVIHCSSSSFIREVRNLLNCEQFLRCVPGYSEVVLNEQDIQQIKQEISTISIPKTGSYCLDCYKQKRNWHEWLAETGQYDANITERDGFVYFLKNGFNWKIGATNQNNPLDRVKEHTKYFPELKLEILIWCDKPFEIERWFHSYFDERNQRVHGRYELFKFDTASEDQAWEDFYKSDLCKTNEDRNKLFIGAIRLASHKIICDLH